MESLLQDLRYAVRALGRTPGFTLTAVITLGVGIALSTTAFSLYEGVALRPLAVKSPGEIVRIVAPRDRSPGEMFPYATYLGIQSASRSLAGVVATSAPELLMTRDASGGEEVPASARFVSDDYFTVLGVHPALGRLPAPGSVDEVVISDGFWRARLNGTSAVLGSTVLVENRPLRVVGVAPGAFAGTGSPPATPDLWIPAAEQPLLLPAVDWLHVPGERQWQVLGRLSPGRTIAGARAELAIIAKSLAPVDSELATLSAKPATLFQTDSGEFETFGQVMMVLLVAVTIILFIGAGNLVGLVAVRNAGRDRELAVRAALGASRGRVGRLLLVESMVLGLAGGGLGLLTAVWLGDLVNRWLTGLLIGASGGTLRLTLNLSPGWTIVAFALGLSLMVGLAVGAWPTLQTARRDLHAALKSGGGGSPERSRSHVLLAAQLAVSLVLLGGAGLLIGGARRARTTDPGFDAGHLLLLDLDTRTLRANPVARTALLSRVTERLRGLPDVETVAWTNRVPFAGHAFRTVGYPTAPVTFSVKSVSPNYFDALGVRLISGRSFTPEESAAGRGVMIVSASVARRYWPGENPVGRSVSDHPWLARNDSQPSTIVGVVADMRGTYLSRVDEGLYYPEPLGPQVILVIRTRSRPANEARPVLTALASIDPLLPTQATVVPFVDGPMRLQQMLSDAPAVLAGGLAAIGLLLAALGLYGMVVQLVNRRTREIGVRVALGASWREIVVLVLRGTLRPTIWGGAAGFVGVLATSALFAKMLAMPDAPDLTYGKGTYDPATFALVLGVLALTAMLASIGPARRALRVDPVDALRNE